MIDKHSFESVKPPFFQQKDGDYRLVSDSLSHMFAIMCRSVYEENLSELFISEPLVRSH